MPHRHPNPRRLRVVTYLRVATETPDDRSVQEQAERVRALAESLGWQPVAVFVPARPSAWRRRLRRR